MGSRTRAVVSTAFAATTRRLARLAPELPRAIGYPRDRYGVSQLRWPARADARRGCGAAGGDAAAVPLLLRSGRADTLSLHHTLCSRAAVRTAHRAGAPVLAWTANDPDAVRRLAALGVDAIVSDDPEMALATLAVAVKRLLAAGLFVLGLAAAGRSRAP